MNYSSNSTMFKDFLESYPTDSASSTRGLLVKTLGTQHAIATAYHPQTNDLCEMTAGTLSGILTSLMVG